MTYTANHNQQNELLMCRVLTSKKVNLNCSDVLLAKNWFNHAFPNQNLDLLQCTENNKSILITNFIAPNAFNGGNETMSFFSGIGSTTICCGESQICDTLTI